MSSTVRTLITEAAVRSSTAGERPRACVHTAGTKYVCDRHPSLGPLCGSCASAHAVRRNHGLGPCPACGREDEPLLTVLVCIGDGRYVEGLAFCFPCLLTATTGGRRLAA